MNVLQHKRNELNLCLQQNRPDRSYRDTLLSRRMTDDPVDAFLLLLPMKMMMVTISTKKMDDNDTEVDNNYDI